MGKGRVKIVFKEVDRFGHHPGSDYKCEECIMGSELPFVGLRHENGSMTFIAYDNILQLRFIPVKED